MATRSRAVQSPTDSKPAAPVARAEPAARQPTRAARNAAASHRSSDGKWTFLTNYAHVLILLARNPSAILRDVAAEVGITERAVQRIIADLAEGGFIEREKVGRQNHYRIRTDQPLRHPIESHRTIGDLLKLVDGEQ